MSDWLKSLKNIFQINSLSSNIRKMTFLPKLTKTFFNTLFHHLIFFLVLSIPRTWFFSFTKKKKLKIKIFLIFWILNIFLSLETTPKPSPQPWSIFQIFKIFLLTQPLPSYPPYPLYTTQKNDFENISNLNF